jgi:predicted ribosomally synthesized peptide with SipW-like signal peptide
MTGSFAHGDSPLDILAAAASVVGAVGVVGTLAYFASRWWSGRKPITVTYVAPDETPLNELTLPANAENDVLFRITAKTDVEIRNPRIRLESEGDSANEPLHEGRMPPRFAESMPPNAQGQAQYRDTFGAVRLVSEHGQFPQIVPQGHTCHFQERIVTRGPWFGYAYVTVTVAGRDGRFAKNYEDALHLDVR